jgi:hypothetical protein
MNRFQAHQTHQSLSAFAIDGELVRDPAAAEVRTLQIQSIDGLHPLQVLGGFCTWLVVEGRTFQAQQLALPPHAELRMIDVDQRALGATPLGQLFF